MTAFSAVLVGNESLTSQCGQVLLDRGKKLTGYPDRMVMPNGVEVRYDEAFRVDKRKWDQKGLAYVDYRREGREARVVVDDLKYDRAVRVLDRLLARFQGELIEKVAEPEEPEEEAGPGGTGA